LTKAQLKHRKNRIAIIPRDVVKYLKDYNYMTSLLEGDYLRLLPNGKKSKACGLG